MARQASEQQVGYERMMQLAVLSGEDLRGLTLDGIADVAMRTWLRVQPAVVAAVSGYGAAGSPAGMDG